MNNEEQGSNWGSNMSGVGSLLAGGAALLGMGDKESSGRNLGVKSDEFNQQSLYKYGITPYEALSAGANGNGANAIQGEANSARQFDAQMKMAAKELKLKADELQTSRRNVDAQNDTQQNVADTNKQATERMADASEKNAAVKAITDVYNTDVNSGRINVLGTGFNPAALGKTLTGGRFDLMTPWDAFSPDKFDPNKKVMVGPTRESFSQKQADEAKKNSKKEPNFIDGEVLRYMY